MVFPEKFLLVNLVKFLRMKLAVALVSVGVRRRIERFGSWLFDWWNKKFGDKWSCLRTWRIRRQAVWRAEKLETIVVLLCFQLLPKKTGCAGYQPKFNEVPSFHLVRSPKTGAFPKTQSEFIGNSNVFLTF